MIEQICCIIFVFMFSFLFTMWLDKKFLKTYLTDIKYNDIINICKKLKCQPTQPIRKNKEQDFLDFVIDSNFKKR